MIARLLCWLRLHDREVVIAEILDLRRPLFEYECSRCKTRWRRIPARRFRRAEWEAIDRKAGR